MSGEQINHAEEAMHCARSAWKDRGELSRAEVLAQGQIHATLALVAATERAAEQARIANLIALNLSAEQLGRGTSVELGYEVSGLLADEQVRKGLGL